MGDINFNLMGCTVYELAHPRPLTAHEREILERLLSAESPAGTSSSPRSPRRR